jgi:predicted transposase YbfD/YdcC
MDRVEDHWLCQAHSGETTIEARYFIASITDIEHFAKSVRGHWQMENKLHWCLDS